MLKPILGSFPRFILEALGLIFIVLLGTVLVVINGPGYNVVPTLGALALGSQRLLPSLQQIYKSWAAINGYKSSIEDLISMLRLPIPQEYLYPSKFAYPFSNAIEFNNVSFSYSGTNTLILNNINLVITKGQRIGIVGSTGTGKSTFVDLLMGLLLPTSGKISIDTINLHSTTDPQFLNQWRSSIAHVPQSIFLADASIAENIAFGVPKDIDLDKIKKCYEIAEISGFIESSPNQYFNHVGERVFALVAVNAKELELLVPYIKNLSCSFWMKPLVL